MPNKDRTTTKSGKTQVCLTFDPAILNQISENMERFRGRWEKDTDFIREATFEKIRRILKGELP